MNKLNPEKESYSEIGVLLRRAREEMRMPIDQASRLLHIRVRYLDALEEGRLEELPGLPYTKGYLQSYAAFLGLDRDEILRRFEEVEKALADSNFYFPQVFSKEKTPNNELIWGGLAIAALCYGIWALFIKPPPAAISMVDKFPVKTEKVHVSANSVKDVSCLRPQDRLYPPCTLAKEPVYIFNPLPRQLKSVMDLARK
jgi:cytoskeletal protein RodZ